MDENAKRKWDVVFAWITLFTVVIGGGWELYKFRSELEKTRHEETERVEADRKANHRMRKREANAFIFQHQSSLYFDLTRVAATIATSTDAKSIKEAKARFNQLFWGELVTVEDRRVELAVNAFHTCIEHGSINCERGKVDIDNAEIRNDKRGIPVAATVRDLSLDIGSCARSALQTGQKIKFGDAKALAAKCPYSRKKDDQGEEFDPED